MADRSRSRFWSSSINRRGSSLRSYTAPIAPAEPPRMSHAASEPSASGTNRRASRDFAPATQKGIGSPFRALLDPERPPRKSRGARRPWSPTVRANTTRSSAVAIWWAYGADPNPVTGWVREHCPLVVRGNHDRASTGQDDLEWFNPVARACRGLDARESHAGYRAIRTRSAAGSAHGGWFRGGARGAVR